MEQTDDLEQRGKRAIAEIDAAWRMIEGEFDIESRAELERQSATNGFKFGLAQAVHHMWKRDPQVSDLLAALELARADCAGFRDLALGIAALIPHPDEAPDVCNFRSKLRSFNRAVQGADPHPGAGVLERVWVLEEALRKIADAPDREENEALTETIKFAKEALTPKGPTDEH